MNLVKQTMKQRTALLVLLLALGAFSFASIGDGNKKSKKKSKSNATTNLLDRLSNHTVSASNVGYYKVSMFSTPSKVTSGMRAYSSAYITYQKGNNTFILPYRYKMPLKSKVQVKSNLQMLSVRLNISGK
jgi:hypothetical protein